MKGVQMLRIVMDGHRLAGSHRSHNWDLDPEITLLHNRSYTGVDHSRYLLSHWVITDSFIAWLFRVCIWKELCSCSVEALGVAGRVILNVACGSSVRAESPPVAITSCRISTASLLHGMRHDSSFVHPWYALMHAITALHFLYLSPVISMKHHKQVVYSFRYKLQLPLVCNFVGR